MATEKRNYSLNKAEFAASQKNNILEFIEQKEINVHFHCRDGFCGACRTKILEGEITYHKEPLAFIRKGDFLPCCSIPSQDLLIEVEVITESSD